MLIEEKSCRESKPGQNLRIMVFPCGIGNLESLGSSLPQLCPRPHPYLNPPPPPSHIQHRVCSDAHITLIYFWKSTTQKELFVPQVLNQAGPVYCSILYPTATFYDFACVWIVYNSVLCIFILFSVSQSPIVRTYSTSITTVYQPIFSLIEMLIVKGVICQGPVSFSLFHSKLTSACYNLINLEC